MFREKKIFLITLLLIISCLIAVGCGSNSENGPSNTSEPSSNDCMITIKTEGGMPLENIEVYIYTDDSLSELVWFAKSDVNGVIAFKDSVDDKTIAILKNVPDGYEVDEKYYFDKNKCDVLLKTKIEDADISSKQFNAGDIITDFTFTDTDGNSYKISDVLKEKKAVVLNFWYTSCVPCDMEFPYLDSAYLQYSNDIALFAINPIDKSNQTITDYKADNELSIPMGSSNINWENVFNFSSYPTTVVIDRYGMVSYIHNGYITSADVFTDLFGYYTSDNYVQSVLKNIEDISNAAGTEGTAENPYEFGGVTEFEVTVPANKTVYCDIYKVSGMVMTVTGNDISLEYQNETFSPQEGKISITVTTPDTFTPVKLAVTNKSDKECTYSFEFTNKKGTAENPYALSLGEFITNIAEGNESGVYYTYTADKNGIIKLISKSITAGVEYEFVLYNLNTYVYNTMSSEGIVDEKTGYKVLSIKVNSGDVLRISIATLPDSSNKIPAGEFITDAVFEESSQSDEEIKPEKVEYSITVKDNSGNPIRNLKVWFVDGSNKTELTTNTKGIASIEYDEGSYSFLISIPEEYEANKDSFAVTKTSPSVTATLNKKAVQKDEKTYTITVSDVNGNNVNGVTVKILQGSNTIFTKKTENGKVTTTLMSDDYVVQIDGIAGGLCYNAGIAKLSVNTTSITIVVAPKASSNVEPLYVGDAIILKEETVYVDLPSDEMNYFVFNPQQSGLYQVTLSNTGAVLSYWGANDNFITDQSSSVDINNNSFLFNVKDGNVGINRIIGAVGDTGALISIKRVGDAQTDIGDLVYDIYQPTKEPSKTTINAGKVFTYIDITGTTANNKLVYNNQDGYYHIGSENGPIAYVSLGDKTPYISYSALISNTGVKVILYDSNGNIEKKEDYTECLMKYVSCMDDTYGVYALDNDLMYILKNHINYIGWTDYLSQSYLFENVEDVNSEISWMFLICYIK